MVANNFEMNSGDASVIITTKAKISFIDLTILEGKYIDERIQISIENVDTISNIFQVHSN